MSTCSSCGADIVWALTTSGKRMPLDPTPNDAGNLYTRRAGSGTLLCRPRTGDAWPDEHPAMPHWSTCPNADAHRKAT